MHHSHNHQLVLETSSEIQSCISLIKQAAGLPFNFPVEIGDLTFQLCNMGGELVAEAFNHLHGDPGAGGIDMQTSPNVCTNPSQA